MTIQGRLPGDRQNRQTLTRVLVTGLLLLLPLPAALTIGAMESPAPKEKLFLIVAPEAFHSSLKEYTRAKEKTFPTRLVSLEKILKESSGADDPERLKRFLYKAWKEEKLAYVLLVGDVDVVPVRYMVLDRATPAAFDYAFYPSDLYYSDLARQDGTFDDWNARKDGFHASYYGEVRGEKNKNDPINYDQIDYLPEVAVGRWPVSSAEEAGVVAAKTLAYESQIAARRHPGEHFASIFHVGGWVDARERMDRLIASLPTGWQSEKRYFKDSNPRFATPAPDETGVLSALNKGAGLVIHVGHGSETTWEECFSTKSLEKVHNADRLPVVVSGGCSTAYFAPLPPYQAYVDIHGKEHAGTDKGEVFKAPPPPPSPYQKGKYNPTGLGEQLLKRGSDGAVAYIGCNTGSQPCGLTLLDGFVKGMGEQEKPRLGDCWMAAIRHYHRHEKLASLKPNEDWYPPSIFFQGMKFMVFGDPTLPLAMPAGPSRPGNSSPRSGR